MIAHRYISGLRSEGYIEVDAARLLLILSRFALPCDPAHPPPCLPSFSYSRHFPSEAVKQSWGWPHAAPACSRIPHATLCATANHNATDFTFSTPRTSNRNSPRFRACAFTHSIVDARSR